MSIYSKGPFPSKQYQWKYGLILLTAILNFATDTRGRSPSLISSPEPDTEIKINYPLKGITLYLHTKNLQESTNQNFFIHSMYIQECKQE
jgi:hypothetical protein